MEKNNNNNKKKNDDEKDEEEDRSGFRSSREALRRSQSSPALREQRGALLSSGQRLWGKDFDENDGDTTLQRILRENKARRAPRTQYVGLEGREWRIEGWTGQGAQQPMHVYHDVALLAQGVTVQKCNFAVVTIATKISHLMINNVNNSKIRLNKGCVTSVELVHCENVELTIASVPVVQIDLCRDITILFADNNSRPKLVHSSNQNVFCGQKLGPREQIGASMFGEQIVTYFVKEANGSWKRMEVDTNKLKDGDSFIELAGIAGSTVDLAEMEEKAQKK